MIVEGMSDVDSNISSEESEESIVSQIVEGGDKDLVNYGSAPAADHKKRSGSMVNRAGTSLNGADAKKAKIDAMRRSSELVSPKSKVARNSIFTDSRRSSQRMPDRSATLNHLADLKKKK